MISWKVTRQESRDIGAIAKRAVKLLIDYKIEEPANTTQKAELTRDIVMDITACHANGCKLQLGRLRHADDANFGHDVLGIRRFIDRKTGKIPEHLFWPRCGAHVEVSQ